MHPIDQLLFARRVVMLAVATGAFIMLMKIVTHALTFGID